MFISFISTVPVPVPRGALSFPLVEDAPLLTRLVKQLEGAKPLERDVLDRATLFLCSLIHPPKLHHAPLRAGATDDGRLLGRVGEVVDALALLERGVELFVVDDEGLGTRSES